MKKYIKCDTSNIEDIKYIDGITNVIADVQKDSNDLHDALKIFVDGVDMFNEDQQIFDRNCLEFESACEIVKDDIDKIMYIYQNYKDYLWSNKE